MTNAVHADVLRERGEVAAQRDTAERAGPYWDAWNAYIGTLYQAGVVVKGDGLLPPATATTVRLAGGNRLVQDGPVAATKEQLAGYVVLEVPDLDAALSWAARCPAATFGAVEVRPTLPPPNQG
ncbi:MULTISPECIES: YciI family protein [unclassified Devosia]|uniref:YciI family protein n=1 Tax=unclassified Devosia TaxID=196773 RepID=UPI001ACE37CA|nr:MULTISPECIES: YciI family protein [unclassified Devosia]MBN9360865.1 YciI family protein [Devosia sp.]